MGNYGWCYQNGFLQQYDINLRQGHFLQYRIAKPQ